MTTDSTNGPTYTYCFENGRAVRLHPPVTPEKDAATCHTPVPPPHATANTEEATSGENVKEDIVVWFRMWDRLQREIAEERSSTQA